MVCDRCGRRVEPGDRFCTGCGTALESPPTPPEADDAIPAGGPAAATEQLTDPDRSTAPEPETPEPSPGDPSGDASEATQPIPTGELPETQPLESMAEETAPDDRWGDADPVWAATGPVPEQVATGDLPSTEPITEVWMETVADASATAPAETAEMPAAQPAAMARTPAPRFGLGAITLIGIVTGAVTLVSLFATVVSITSDERISPHDDMPIAFRTGTWIADDLADNLAIAGLLAALCMVVGGVAAGFRWRWGAGLAGGAGLAFAGIAAVAIGLAQIPIDAANEMARIPNEQRFTLTITLDVGYWLLIAAGALGVVLFFASVNDALADRRPGLNPWIAALGALAAVVTAAGPLLPENLAVLSDNWYEGPGNPPALLLVGRVVQLGLLALAGVVGFLSVRRWGLGLAIGGALPALWLTVSTLFELTDAPVGPGFRNPGATDMHVHGVTIIGVSALAAMGVLATIAAYDQGMRERR